MLNVCKVPEITIHAFLLLLYLSSTTKIVVTQLPSLIAHKNIVYCFPSVWRKKSEVGQKRRKRQTIFA